MGQAKWISIRSVLPVPVEGTLLSCHPLSSVTHRVRTDS